MRSSGSIPEVVALAGISEEELASYKAPAKFASQSGKVVQPPVDPSKPQLGYPRDVLDKLMNTPDEKLKEGLTVTPSLR